MRTRKEDYILGGQIRYQDWTATSKIPHRKASNPLRDLIRTWIKVENAGVEGEDL